MTQHKIFKLCHNKGNARIWIERKNLSDNGFMSGMKFNKEISDNKILLKFDKNATQHKISGSPERPIIDLSGKYLSNFFAGFNQYKVTFKKDLIIIERHK